MENRTCCFFGHRRVKITERLFSDILEQIEICITKKNIVNFLLGGYGNFDVLCFNAVQKMKEKYSFIKSIYVQAYYNYKDHTRMALLKNNYDEVIYPEIEDKPKRFAITYRNHAMIDMCDYCIFYVFLSYGGALNDLQYAKRKNKQYINLAESYINK